MDHIKRNNQFKYKIGDVLYIRETWCKGRFRGEEERYYYKADNVIPHCEWYPSIHMPKEAARIFLRVTDVRVERLQDITDEEILQEGIYKSLNPYMDCYDYVYESNPKRWFSSQRHCFAYGLWDSTVKKSDLDKYGWAANPLVWVIEFELLEVEA